jgi:hypothetical protein
LVPRPNGSDDFIRISRPGERLGRRIRFSDVPVDGLLKIDHRTEDATAVLQHMARALVAAARA